MSTRKPQQESENKDLFMSQQRKTSNVKKLNGWAWIDSKMTIKTQIQENIDFPEGGWICVDSGKIIETLMRKTLGQRN